MRFWQLLNAPRRAPRALLLAARLAARSRSLRTRRGGGGGGGVGVPDRVLFWRWLEPRFERSTLLRDVTTCDVPSLAAALGREGVSGHVHPRREQDASLPANGKCANGTCIVMQCVM